MLRNAIHGAPSWLGRVGQGIFVALILLPLFFTPAHAASLTLSWTDASTNEDGFHVQRKTGTGGTYATLTTTAAGTTGYVDGTVTAGTTYCYHVSAYNSAGDSAFSNEACAAPASATMYTVAVTKAGTGSGTVASSPAAINCGSTCSASIANGTSLALSATPAAGSTFTGWSGAYTGTGNCALVVDNNKNLTATFALSASTTYALTLTKAGTGSGTVTSSPTGINCGSTCSTSFNSGTSVTLTAAATAGSTFTGWSGACSGTGTCAVTMSATRSVTATFATSGATTYALTVTKAGTGSGTVTSSPTGINCGSTCSTSFNSGTSVTLTAAATAGSTFTGWSGAGCSGTGTCAVTMSAARSVTATFNASTPVTLTGLTANKTSPQLAGTAITFTAAATGGASPQYRWWVYNGSTWLLGRDWATGATYTWTPGTPGALYRIAVHVRPAGGTWGGASGGEIIVPFMVTGSNPLALTGLTTDKASPQRAGTAVTFTATATGGAPPYEYRWWVYNGTTWLLAKAWGSSNTFTLPSNTPAALYRIAVHVRPAGGTWGGASGGELVVPFTVTP